MKAPFNGETCRNSASLPTERKLKKQGSKSKKDFENTANSDSDNCIGCTKEDKPMFDFTEALSGEDVKYIRNLLAEGIARMLVEKVAKSSDLAVDGLEPERYNPSTKKGGTFS